VDELPHWEPGTPAVLSTGAGAPHAIPVSTALRAGPRRVVLALALRRESLRRLRHDPRCALTVLAAGDVAFTAHARARVVADPMAASERVAAVALDVEEIQDHRQPDFVIGAGVAWTWTDAAAAERDAAIRGALAELARL
jgi:hypothetical protein